MTVTLAFKAFAKAIPCSTPFLATSDPFVLKRILAYIRRLPLSSNIFVKANVPDETMSDAVQAAPVMADALERQPEQKPPQPNRRQGSWGMRSSTGHLGTLAGGLKVPGIGTFRQSRA